MVKSKMIKLIKLWILGSAACISAGWILSAFHQLNMAGYAVIGFLSALGLVVIYQHRQRKGPAAGEDWPRWRPRRFLRPLPLLFLLTAFLAALGGAVHPPNNYDALTYRFPRMLHWWANSGWLWIITPNERMNLSGTAFEWLMMPLFVVTHSDRLFFLINIIAYLLIPSLVFLLFVTAGMPGRTARFWMWLLPAALCYAMQAGSISNDTIATTYFLSAIFFALHARRARAVRYLWLSFLAAGLLTGVKASNLPLLLPIAWAMWPALPLVEKRFASSMAVVGVSLLVSFLPTALLNQHYTGDWAGDSTNRARIKVQKPLAGIVGNCLQLGLQGMEPPFLPVARSAEIWIWNHFPARLQTVLKNDFPRFGVGFRELPQEESAGLGIGITVMAIISLGAAWRFRHQTRVPALDFSARQGIVIGLLTWVSLLVYMAKLGSESTSRLIAAYYPLLLLPLLLSPAQELLVRQRWYRGLGVCAGMIAVMAVILTPSRPLWPAEQFLNRAVQEFPRSKLLAQAKKVYWVYHCRSDVFGSLRQTIPQSVTVIGVIEGGDDVESSLWRPFGLRRVVHVLEGDRSQESKLQWLVVKDSLIGGGTPQDFEQWLQRDGGVLVARQTIIEKAGAGPETWKRCPFSRRRRLKLSLDESALCVTLRAFYESKKSHRLWRRRFYWRASGC